jgi:hypothetical protein
MAATGFSEALLAQLREEEANLAGLKTRLASAARESRPKVLPHPRLIQRCIDQLLDFLAVDPEKARAVLVRHMPPLILTPERQTYRITGGFNLSLFLDDQPGVIAPATPTAPPSPAADPASVAGSMTSRVGGTGYSTYHRPPVWVGVEAVVR